MDGISFYLQATKRWLKGNGKHFLLPSSRKKLAQGQWKALPFTFKPQKDGSRVMESTSFYRQATKSQPKGNGKHFLLPSSRKKLAQGQWKALPFTVKPQKASSRAMESTSFDPEETNSLPRVNGAHSVR